MQFSQFVPTSTFSSYMRLLMNLGRPAWTCRNLKTSEGGQTGLQGPVCAGPLMMCSCCRRKPSNRTKVVWKLNLYRVQVISVRWSVCLIHPDQLWTQDVIKIYAQYIKYFAKSVCTLLTLQKICKVPAPLQPSSKLRRLWSLPLAGKMLTVDNVSTWYTRKSLTYPVNLSNVSS